MKSRQNEQEYGSQMHNTSRIICTVGTVDGAMSMIQSIKLKCSYSKYGLASSIPFSASQMGIYGTKTTKPK